MSLLWREQLSVGNNVIDADHKYLIEIINWAEVVLTSKGRSKWSSSSLDSCAIG